MKTRRRVIDSSGGEVGGLGRGEGPHSVLIPDAENTATGEYSATLGGKNINGGNKCLINGTNNIIRSTGDPAPNSNFVNGQGLIVEGTDISCNLLNGRSSKLYSGCYSNSLLGDSHVVSRAYYNLVNGLQHTLTGGSEDGGLIESSIINGFKNSVVTSGIKHVLLSGSDLKASTSYQVLFGKFASPSSDTLMAYSWGDNQNDAKNLIQLYKNGNFSLSNGELVITPKYIDNGNTWVILDAKTKGGGIHLKTARVKMEGNVVIEALNGQGLDLGSNMPALTKAVGGLIIGGLSDRTHNNVTINSKVFRINSESSDNNGKSVIISAPGSVDISSNTNKVVISAAGGVDISSSTNKIVLNYGYVSRGDALTSTNLADHKIAIAKDLDDLEKSLQDQIDAIVGGEGDEGGGGSLASKANKGAFTYDLSTGTLTIDFSLI